MRRHFLASAFVVAFCVLAGCNIGQEDKPSACEQDESLCPVSSRIATDVGCDCHCVAGYAGITPTREFDGEISTCLPPALNSATGSEEQRDNVGALTDAQFNQRVYKFCSDTVASYLGELIEQQQRPRDLKSMCVGPRIKCTCGTKGAPSQQTSVCSAPCEDKECDKDNCQPLLRVGGLVDASGCGCSRVNACGDRTPSSGESPVCLNRAAAVQKRKMKP